MIKSVLPVSLALCCAMSAASAAPVNYEMNLRTYAGFGAGGAMGMMFGAGGATKQMDLRLTNPTDIPAGYNAEHIVPQGMRIGPALPLKGERRGGGDGHAGEDSPDGRVLLYWGCGASVAKGQPEIFDFRSLGGQVPPEVAAMARQSRSRRGEAGESLPPRTLWWPHGDRGFQGIPAEASAVGEHVVQASFMAQEIRYALDAPMDFLEPMNLKAAGSDLKAAIPLSWDALGRARGYNLQAVGAVGEKEVVIWLAAKNRNPMLPGSQTSCTVPAGIFAKTEGAMAMGEAVGPVRHFAYPPQKPGEKKPLIWTVRVRVTGYDNVMLGMEAMGRESAGEAAAGSVVPGGGGMFDALKGIFGK